MDQFFIKSRARVHRGCILHVKRMLPAANCQILVGVGDEVTPESILGTGHLPAGFHVIHLSKELKVSRKSAQSFIKRRFGEVIYKGEILIEGRGLFGLGKKIIQAPTDCILELYDPESGDLRLRLLPKITKVASGVFGIVDRVDAAKKIITLRTLADVVFGMFGSGKEREGIIDILSGADAITSPRQILPQMEGRVLALGSMVSYEVIRKAVMVGVSGLISGGINTEEYQATNSGQWSPYKKSWADIGISLVVTEGFGPIPVGDDVFSVIRGHKGRYAIIDGNRARLILPSYEDNCMIKIRTANLPGDSDIEPTSIEQVIPLKKGIIVRVISMPFLGVQGIVESIDRTPTKLPSGVLSVMVTVITSRQKVRVPLANIEAI